MSRYHHTRYDLAIRSYIQSGFIIIALAMFAGCGDDGATRLQPDASGDMESGGADANSPSGDPGDGGLSDPQDASGVDAGPGGLNPDATPQNDGDASPNDTDARTDDDTDASPPENTGIQECISACETFLSTDCNQPSAMFCQSNADNCQLRYDTGIDCLVELAAMDACAAMQMAFDFVCPLGTVPDPIRPYHLSEDACVSESIALSACLDG